MSERCERGPHDGVVVTGEACGPPEAVEVRGSLILTRIEACCRCQRASREFLENKACALAGLQRCAFLISGFPEATTRDLRTTLVCIARAVSEMKYPLGGEADRHEEVQVLDPPTKNDE